MLFFYFLTVVHGTITFYTDRHCACSELHETSCTILKDYCNWDAGGCSEKTTNCSLTNATSCNATTTSFNCKAVDGQCIDHRYDCQEFGDAVFCPRFLGCYWNENLTCDTFSNCKDYSIKYCPYEKGCITNQGQCTDMNYVDCQTISDQNDCYGYASASSTCLWNSVKMVCQQIDDNSECPSLSGFQLMCQNYGCMYYNDICRYKECSDYIYEPKCSSIKNGRNSYKLCSWSNDKCVEAENTSTLLDLSTCLSISKYNYKWTGECVQCSQLINNSFAQGFLLLAIIYLQTMQAI